MLQVIVRVFDGTKWLEIETIDIQNFGENKNAFVYGVRRYPNQFVEVDHDRKDGALVLVRKALEQLEERKK